jgi:hypothetical protein
MQTTRLTLIVVAAAAAAGCGGSSASTDASPQHDGGPLDGAGIPDPPALGAQLDRAGRAGISTLLIGTFAADPARTALRAAYNLAPDPAAWRTAMLQTNLSIERELANNLAVFDALDAGMTSVMVPGCGNAIRYAGPPGPTSYKVAADLFADDQLYVDTAKTTCTQYLALEIEFASLGGTPHSTCGGRTPTHDVVDAMYSLLAAGIDGLDRLNDLTPRITDNVAAHADVKSAFPFLGPPH